MAHIEVPHPGASEIVGRLLSEALNEHPDVQWLGLVSEDGFAIASEGAFAVDDDAVAAGAVRMMIQVRSMSKALGQSGVSQMFLEGSESGICVIDKDPWVLVLVGAPGVPIGLLRYEAREIAEAFPMGQRPALPVAEPPVVASEDLVDVGVFTPEPVQTWSDEVTDVDGETEIRWADEPTVSDVDVPQVDQEVTDPDGDIEIRWADEPTTDEAPAVEPEVSEAFADLTSAPEDADETGVISTDFAAWLATDEPAAAPVVEVATEVEESISLVDLSDLSAPEPAPAIALTDLAPPAGPSVDLPPPMGQAYQLPPPV